MKQDTEWTQCMLGAAEHLGRACTEAANRMSGGEVNAREIKELAGAMKELAALRATLTDAAPPDDHGSAVQIFFAPDSESWSQ